MSVRPADEQRSFYTVLHILMEDCAMGSLETLMGKYPVGLTTDRTALELLHKICVQSASAFAFLAINQRMFPFVRHHCFMLLLLLLLFLRIYFVLF